METEKRGSGKPLPFVSVTTGCLQCPGVCSQVHGLFNPITPMSENQTPMMKPGLFGWNELITSDVEGAKKFYAAMFGWEAETKSVAPGWDYTMFKCGDTMVGGMIGISPEMGPVPPHWLSYVISDDIEADLAKAKAAGGTVLKEAMEVPNAGTLAIIRDPQGAVFALWKCNMEASCECQ